MRSNLRQTKLTAIRRYPGNARKRKKGQIERLARIIEEFGFQQPIVVDQDGVIVVGDGRYQAAELLNLDKVPVIWANLTEAQARAYRIADNRIHEDSDWETEKLRLEVGEMRELWPDLTVLGMTSKEITALLRDSAQNVPETPVEPISGQIRTKPGDVWELGSHRIVCGDSTDPETWSALGVGSDYIVFSSPPYNVGRGAQIRKEQVRGDPQDNAFYDEYDDNLDDAGYTQLLTETMRLGFRHCDTVVYNLQLLAGSKRGLVQWLADNLTHLVDIVTWDKCKAAPHIQPGIMSARFEWLVIMSRGANASRIVPHSSWHGTMSNVYSAGVPRNEHADVHGAVFPIHLPRFVLGDLLNACQGVVDCFAGIGTTMLAAESLGMPSRLIELSPQYVDVSIKRWQKQTGQRAVHAETREPFDEGDSDAEGAEADTRPPESAGRNRSKGSDEPGPADSGKQTATVHP